MKAEKFKSPNVDPDMLFEHSFGITVPHEGQHIEEVILSYSALHGKYFKSLPLHHTQEIVVHNDEEIRMKLNMYVTHDFVMELLPLDAEVKVITPRKSSRADERGIS